MDECEDIIPEYFNFIVYSEDSHLNISRDTLRQRIVLKVIIKSIAFGEIAEDRDIFQAFYEAFGNNSKLSIDEDAQNSKLAEFLAPTGLHHMP
jgi:molecular chaperone HtpG